MGPWNEASAPARVDLAGGTLDLWPLHVLHPGSVTVNLAIDLRARCRVRAAVGGFRVTVPELGYERTVQEPARLLADPRSALAGAMLEALEIDEPREIELSSDVPFGSGLGGSSALTVAMAAALAASVERAFDGDSRVEFVRDVETRVLGKPAGTQDYYPPLSGGVHTLRFHPGGVAGMIPELHREAHDLVALFPEEQSRDRRIDPPRHGHRDAHRQKVSGLGQLSRRG